jgi:large subunit ribosomal protein L30
VVVANTPSFRGMVKKVIHMVDFEEIDQAAGSPTKA